MTNELCYLPAAEALKRFRRRRLSPVEVLEAQIERAGAVGSKINAFTDTYFEAALAKAKKAEARFARKHARIRPLEGLTVAIKDEGHIAGQRTTNGSLIWKDQVATGTDIFLQRLLDAGAIVHARTATPEFSCAAVTHSRLWGVTRNPWNRRYTPGGSSGGSAAALAAGLTTLANGSDIGGSVRIPASCCGVTGFKPPYGRIPEAAYLNLDFYCHEGSLARSIADLAMLQNVMAGPHPRDIASLRPKLEIPDRLGGIKGWRIAYSLDLDYFKVDRQVRENTLAAVEVFRSLGCRVEPVKLGWTIESGKAAWDYLCHIFGASMAPLLAAHGKLMTPYARAFIRIGRKSSAADFVASLDVAARMYETFGALMERYHVFVCPTLAKPAVLAGDPLDYATYRAKGKVIPDALQWCMTYPFNMLSRCPVMSVPSGQAVNGVPTGVQIVGRTYDDVRVFRAAGAYMQALGWNYEAGRRPVL